MAKTKQQTKAPTGLKVERSGLKFVFSWKIAAANSSDGQIVGYKLYFGNGKTFGWWYDSIGVNKTSWSHVNFDASDVYPAKSGKANQIVAIEFGVRNNRADTSKTIYTWSDFKTVKYTINKPAKPSLSWSLNSSPSYSGTFSWNLSTSTTDHKHFTDVCYKTWLSTGSEPTSWTTGQAASGSRSYTESATAIKAAGGKLIRYFKVKARGIAGDSDANLQSHTYGDANTPSKVWAKITGESANVYNLNVTWKLSDGGKKIASATPKYAFATPLANYVCPSGASFDGDTPYKADASGNVNIQANGVLGVDECMFVRVDTERDGVTTIGNAYLVSNGYGRLTTPSNLSSTSISSASTTVDIICTNESDVTFSYLEFSLQTNDGKITVIGHSAQGSGVRTTTCSLPDMSEVTSYKIYARAITAGNKMTSDSIAIGGATPSSPQNVTVTRTNTVGKVLVSWTSVYSDAKIATISWSDEIDAWESTDEPDEYTWEIDGKTARYVTGLDTGKTWYFRVREATGTESTDIHTPWSTITDDSMVSLTDAPVTTQLYLSENAVSSEGSITAYWVYASGDGTEQATADICVATISSGGIITYGDIIASATNEQSIDIDISELGWADGDVKYLAIRTTSASGETSEWSDVEMLTIKDAPVPTISTNLTADYVVIDDDEETRTIPYVMETLPLTISSIGAGAGGQTIATITRLGDCQITRPDESTFDGYDGETIAQVEIEGDGTLTIAESDLIGQLDDGCQYTITIKVIDYLGQTGTATADFTVHWSHQAWRPTGTITIQDNIAVISIADSNNKVSGDVCDIYRLSADAPELIYQGAEFGETYVDPYPALGEFGGHRLVCRTLNGDYTTDDNMIAWTDFNGDDGDILESKYMIIDFAGEQLEVEYNLEFDNKWSKDFERTRYLGGSITGDWNVGIERDMSTSTVMLSAEDIEKILQMRKLAEYTDLCHVRTPDGSSFAADIQVSDSAENNIMVSYSLDIKKVAPEGFEGMAYGDYEG